MLNDPAAPTDEPHAEAEAMLRKHAAMYDWTRAEARSINDFILTARFGVQESIREALRAHWLTGVECHHDRKTDTAHCYCTVWSSGEQPSVGAAVDVWVAHVMEAIAR